MSLTKGAHINHTPEQLANLKSCDKMTPEELREFSRKGGIASQKKRAQAKTFKEAAEWLMSLPAFETENDAVNAIKAQYPTLTNGEAMTAAVMKKAIDEGDHKAFTTIRDTTGELPEQTVNIKNEEPMTINIKTIG